VPDSAEDTAEDTVEGTADDEVGRGTVEPDAWLDAGPDAERDAGRDPDVPPPQAEIVRSEASRAPASRAVLREIGCTSLIVPRRRTFVSVSLSVGAGTFRTRPQGAMVTGEVNMTSVPTRPELADDEHPDQNAHLDKNALLEESLSVQTRTVDELRATVRVTGVLSDATAPLLTGVLDGHRKAGRRYVRIDLAGCGIAEGSLLVPLREQHAAMAEAGGMLVFENASDVVGAMLRRGDLFIHP
jgi:anti-anti-sigma regulatory factor